MASVGFFNMALQPANQMPGLKIFDTNLDPNMGIS